MRNKTVEEYIETIHVLEQQNGRAQTGMIAARMGVKPPSITEMLRKLEREGLIEYTSYGGAVLTGRGREMAQELMKKHRVVADLLEAIGVPTEVAEADACRIEHHISATTLFRLERFLSFMRHDLEAAGAVQRFGETNPVREE